MSATIVQLKHMALMAMAAMNQNRYSGAESTMKIKANNVGTAMSEPTAHKSGSAYENLARRRGAMRLDAPTPKRPEKHVITPNMSGI